MIGITKDFSMNRLDLVLGVQKGYVHGGYLPLYMVGDLISVKKFLTMAWYYSGLPSVVNLDSNLLA